MVTDITERLQNFDALLTDVHFRGRNLEVRCQFNHALFTCERVIGAYERAMDLYPHQLGFRCKKVHHVILLSQKIRLMM